MSGRNARKPRKARTTTGPHRRVLLGEADPAWTYRLAEENSAEEINNALRSVRGKKVITLRDFFPLTLAYSNKIEQGRRRSPLAQPPTTIEIAKRLGELPLESLNKSVAAEVIDIRKYPGTLGIFVTYAGLNDEIALIDSTVNGLLKLRAPRHFTSETPHILIGFGQLNDAGQIAQIENKLPSQVMLSPINPAIPSLPFAQ